MRLLCRRLQREFSSGARRFDERRAVDAAAVVKHHSLAALQACVHRPRPDAHRQRVVDFEMPRAVFLRHDKRQRRAGMDDARGGDAVFVFFQDLPVGQDFVDLQRIRHTRSGRAADRIDVIGDARRAVQVDALGAAMQAARGQQSDEAEAVIAVQMRNEHAAQRRQRQVGALKLLLRAFAAFKQPPLAPLIQLQRQAGNIAPQRWGSGGGAQESEFHKFIF